MDKILTNKIWNIILYTFVIFQHCICWNLKGKILCYICMIISLFIQFREHELKNGCDFNIKVKWERFTTTIIILWYQLYTECCYAHISPSHHGTTIPSVASFTEWFILLVPYSIILYTRYVVFLLPAHARLPSNGIDSPFYCLNT